MSSGVIATSWGLCLQLGRSEIDSHCGKEVIFSRNAIEKESGSSLKPLKDTLVFKQRKKYSLCYVLTVDLSHNFSMGKSFEAMSNIIHYLNLFQSLNSDKMLKLSRAGFKLEKGHWTMRQKMVFLRCKQGIPNSLCTVWSLNASLLCYPRR